MNSDPTPQPAVEPCTERLKAELDEWRSAFGAFGFPDPGLKPLEVACAWERLRDERDDLLLKIAQLDQKHPEGNAKFSAMMARHRQLECRDGDSVWREVDCGKCGKAMVYNNGDERDLTCMDASVVKCWNCGTVKLFDKHAEAELAEATYPTPRALQAERDRYRAIVGHVLEWAVKNRQIWQLWVICGLDEQAARELCEEFGVDAETGETI